MYEDPEVQRILLRQTLLVLTAFHFTAFHCDPHLEAPASVCLRLALASGSFCPEHARLKCEGWGI